MGFRIQKRIKINDKFGVNVSRSGLSPSFRGKKGSLSRRGLSLRSGIAGITYYKGFSRGKKSSLSKTLFTLTGIGVGLFIVVRYLFRLTNRFTSKNRH